MGQSKREIMQGVEGVVSSKVVANNTVRYKTASGDGVVRLHNTNIVVTRQNGEMVLNSGGWKTPTTRSRINDYIAPWRVVQVNSVWYLDNGMGKRVPFNDGVTIQSDGTVCENSTQPGPGADKKAIRAYVSGYLAALERGDVPAPSGGDCWYCMMRIRGSKETWGEVNHDIDHIVSHMDERYYVPSLLLRAVEVFTVSPAAMMYLQEKWYEQSGVDGSPWLRDVGVEQLRRSLTRYLYRQFGLAT